MSSQHWHAQALTPILAACSQQRPFVARLDAALGSVLASAQAAKTCAERRRWHDAEFVPSVHGSVRVIGASAPSGIRRNVRTARSDSRTTVPPPATVTAPREPAPGQAQGWVGPLGLRLVRNNNDRFVLVPDTSHACSYVVVAALLL